MGRIRNLDKLSKRLRSLTSRKAERLLGAVLVEAGSTIATHAQHSITTGAVSGKAHQPSKAPNPPNNDSGVLANNIEVTQPETLVVHVSSNAPYSEPLEFGTSKMAARPFLRPARDAKRREVRKRFAEQVDRIVKGAAE